MRSFMFLFSLSSPVKEEKSLDFTGQLYGVTSLRLALILCLTLSGFTQPIAIAKQTNKLPELISLQNAINMAQERDESLLKSRQTEQRFEALSQGAKALPDPSISFGVLNLPGDSFNINQEPITQLKVGGSQQLPRGNTLELNAKKYKAIASEQPYLREDRLRVVALQTTHIWLDAYLATASYRLVEETRPLFSKLGDIVSASYAASAGNAKQQDIIRAELELMRLQDRLVQLKTRERTALADLLKYLIPAEAYYTDTPDITHLMLPNKLPEIDKSDLEFVQSLKQSSIESIYPRISHHPLLATMDKRISSASLDIELAQQGYKPQYSLNASYAYRPDGAAGMDRADLFSVGLSVSVPLFSSGKVDADVQNSRLRTESIRTEKRLLAKELIAKLYQASESYYGAYERAEIYKKQILPQMAQQADAAINAYTNDTGDFAEVVRAKIAELDAKITLLNIEVNKRRALAKMHYFLPKKGSKKESTHE